MGRRAPKNGLGETSQVGRTQKLAPAPVGGRTGTHAARPMSLNGAAPALLTERRRREGLLALGDQALRGTPLEQLAIGAATLALLALAFSLGPLGHADRYLPAAQPEGADTP